jgi:hypothetical protein
MERQAEAFKAQQEAAADYLKQMQEQRKQSPAIEE